MVTEADKLREELRNGRNQTNGDSSQAIDGTGTDTQGISRSDVGPQQSISSDVFGSSIENDGIDEVYHDSERSFDEVIKRGRSTDRRPRKSRSGSSSSNEAVAGTRRRAGRLVADDPIPFREKAKDIIKSSGSRSTPTEAEPTVKEEKSIPVQRGKKTLKVGNTASEGEEQKQKFKLPNFKEGTVLTISEAKALEEPLIASLQAAFYYVDQFLWYKTKDTTQAPIWSDLDTEDIQAIALPMLKSGQKSPAVATTVRTMVNSNAYVNAVMLFGPRFIKTVNVLKNAPKVEKPGFLDRKRMAIG